MRGIQISLGRTVVVFDPSWLVILPVGLWALATLYIPILGGDLNPAAAWVVAFIIVVLVAVSFFAHLLAHLFAARTVGIGRPHDVSLFLFGDTAQSWPIAGSVRRECWAALSGIFINLLLAGLSFWLWNAQLNPVFNLSTLFACLFNLWLAVVNMIPGFPFDGGRLARAIFSELSRNPQTPSRLSVRLGFSTALATSAWGLILLVQRARFSGQTGTVTIAFALLIVAGLRAQPIWKWDGAVEVGQLAPHRHIRALGAGLLLLAMFAIASCLLLTNDGLEAPGLALAVEPMVEVTPSHSYPQSGSFILTSVITQAPITAGEWFIGLLSPAVKIVPPETIVPQNTTPREVARQGYQMLDESENTAIVVGLQQANYDAVMIGKGVRVLSIEPDSLARGLLQPGDTIMTLNGKPIQTPSDLINQIRDQDPNAIVRLQVKRDQRIIDLDVPLTPPTTPGDSPKLWITIESAGTDIRLPFPVKIVPQKIVGGPSAGLMFALTVYNMVTPDDLTGGRKIAGTGTINPNGSVGSIGGVEQKVVAAELAGATYFLVPAENYIDALMVADHIQVVKITTVGQAIEFLRSLPPD